MRRVSNLRAVVGLAIVFTLGFAAVGCGGGGGGDGGSIIDQDAAVVAFLIVEEQANGNLVQIGGPDSTNVLRDARLLITFNTPIDLDSVNDRTIRVGNPTPGGLFEPSQGIYYHPVDSSGNPVLNQIIFNPTFTTAGTFADNPEGFDRLAVYDVILPSVLNSEVFVKNLVGDGLVTEYQATFETGSDYVDTGSQPRWEEYLSAPRANSLQVDAQADIIVAFDQPMKRDTFVLGDSFIVTNNYNGTSPLGTLRFSTDLRRAIFRPVFGYGKGEDSTNGGTEPLDPLTDGYELQVTVTRDVTNLSGNPTPRQIEFKFRTRYDASQPNFGDLTEEFTDRDYFDDAYSPARPSALWNDVGGVPGYLTGTFTTGSVTAQINTTALVVSFAPWAVGNTACQFQALYYSNEVGGSSRSITGFSWFKYSLRNSTTCQGVKILLGHTQSGSVGLNFSANYSSPPTQCVGGVTYQIPIGTNVWYAGPTFTSPFAYDGSSNLILEVQLTSSSAAGVGGGIPAGRGWAEWAVANLQPSNRGVTTQPAGSTGAPVLVNQNLYDVRFTYLIDESEARSFWYDSGLTAPQYLDVVLFPGIASQPSGTHTSLAFQGAPALPLGAGQADVANASDWEDHLTDVSGYRFVRFLTVFTGNGLTKQVPAIDTLVIPFIFFTVE